MPPSKTTAKRSIAKSDETAKDAVTIMVVTDSGCEEACVQEIALLIPASDAKVLHGNIVELHGTALDAAFLGYRLQTARRVLIRCAPHLNRIDDVEGTVFDESIRSRFIPQDARFKAECDVLGMTLTSIPAGAAEHTIEDKHTTEDIVDETAEASEDGDDEEVFDEIDDSDASDESAEHDESAPAKRLPIAQELVEAIGGWSYEALQLPVDLKRPNLIIYAVATHDGIDVGIDVVGRSLSKREYRIMLSQRSIKATIAAATIIYAGMDTNGKLPDGMLDPFIDDGTLCIEAALLRTRTSPRKFLPMSDFTFTRFPCLAGHDWAAWKREQDVTRHTDKRDIIGYAGSMREMKALRTNSKLAAVDDSILSTKVDLDWIDLKRDESSVRNIITSPIVSGKSLAAREAAKLQELLFNQSAYLLKRNGAITCITEKDGEILIAAGKHGLHQTARHDVLMGKRRMAIITFKASKSATCAANEK